MIEGSTRAEAADESGGQAASRLALRARTECGLRALGSVAHEFGANAARMDPAVIDSAKDGDAASLIRVQLALERHTVQWLRPRRA